MNSFLKFAPALFMMLMASGAAHATSGPGCLRVVNVAKWDVLNIRAKPAPTSRVVFGIDPVNYGALKLNGACVPKSAKWASRRCPVIYYSGDGIFRGFVKARFVQDSDCP